MLGFNPSCKIYLWRQVADMRKGFDSLSELVRHEHNVELAGKELAYVFFNRRLDRVKILYWEEDGYCTWYKRLEAGKFKCKFKDGVVKISFKDLQSLLRGMEYERIKLRNKVNKTG